jgi:hypothetical protein
MAIQAGSGATSGLRTLTQAATGTVNAFLKLPAPVQAGVTILAGVSGGSLLAVSGLLKVKQTVGEAMQSLRDFGPAGEKAATAIGKVGSVAGKLGLVGAAGLGAYEGLNALGNWIKKDAEPRAHDLDGFTASLKDFASTGKATGDLGKTFGADLSGIGTQIKQVTSAQIKLDNLRAEAHRQAISGGGRDVSGMALPHSNDTKQQIKNVTDLDAALAGLASNGGATQAKLAFDQITRSLTAQGVPMTTVTSEFSQYGKAAHDAAAANGPLAHGFGDVTTNASTMTMGLQDAIDKGQTLTDVFNQLNGAAETSAKAQIGFEQAIDDLTDSFKKNGNTMDITTQKGRDNTTAVLDTVDAAQKAAQAKYDESGSVQAASDTYNGYISKLKQTLTAAHWTDAQIDALIKNYASMPPVVTTTVKTPGLAAANSTARGFSRVMGDMDGKTVSSTIVITTIHNDRAGFSREKDRWGGIHQHAADGLLSSAQTYSAVNPGRYMIAEPSTGGEAFVPRLGDYGRSTSILDQASRWYGGRFMPNGAGGGRAAPVAINITLTGGDASTRAIMREIKSEVSHAFGGIVQVAMGRG